MYMYVFVHVYIYKYLVYSVPQRTLVDVLLNIRHAWQ